MFTVESLKAIKPVKTDDFLSDYHRNEQLKYAILFMEQNQLAELLTVGDRLPDGVSMPAKGARIMIPKGTRIGSLNPKHGSDHVAKRDFEITVFDVNPGHLSPPYHDPEVVIEQPASFTWPGASGYWQTVNMRDWIGMGGVEMTQKHAQ